MGIINNRKALKERRKDLRKNPTPAEELLWRALRVCQLKGRKFRRQHSMGHFILDFYCIPERLVVEVDGAHHYTKEGLEYDAERTLFLNNLGIKVLRFENKEVISDLDRVLKTIASHFKPTSPS